MTPPASKDRDKIIIIDGSSYFFRAYYAIQRLSTSQGFPTNAIYGFINMLMRVLEVEKPKHLMIAFDTAKPSFRKEKYDDYKANRDTPPDDLIVQIPIIQEAVDCFRIARLEKPGFEADDVIATVTDKAVKAGYDVDIITGDKDLMQLVTPHVKLYDTMKDKRIDEDGVVERFQVKPSQIVDLLALMGDSSDNIPGVKGIGEKTAAELIGQFGSLEKLYENLEKIKQPKRREALERDKGNAFMSRELAEVCRTVPLDFSWEELKYNGPDMDRLQGLFEKYEFQQLLKRFDMKREESSFKHGHYEAITDKKSLDALVRVLSKADLISLDTETTSLKIHEADLVGLSFCTQEAKAYYIPVGHQIPGAPGELAEGQLPKNEVLEVLRPILEDEKYPKVGQNLKYDTQILRRSGVHLRGIVSDTLLASYLYDPAIPHNLDALAFRFLKHQNITYEELTGKGKQQIPFSEVPIEKATSYAAEDADVAFRLHGILIKELHSRELENLYEEVEIPLIDVLADMEFRGVLVNEARLKEMESALISDLKKSEAKIYKLAGGAFNIGSPKQLSKILFEKLKLPIIRRTKTGISTDESVLEELGKSHEICHEILEYRGLAKLKSTYVEGLLAQIQPATGRVHTHYNQTVAATGRLSSSEPNLQNIPTGGKYDIRSVFVAPKGTKLLSADYSQVELRLLAAFSKDPELLRAFKHDEDVHAFTARLIFDVKEVSSEQRKIAKTINFGVIYGQTPYGLSQTLKIAPKEAKEFIEKYFERYPKIKSYMEGLVADARKKGYAKTLLGRRRYFPDLHSANRMQREMAERAAVNAPLQGSAADIIKKAMVDLDAALRKAGLKAKMILQVHDELLLEVPHGEEEEVEALVREKMENAVSLGVSLKVDVGWGHSWSECS